MKKYATLITLSGLLAMPAFGQNLAIVNGTPLPLSRYDVVVNRIKQSGQAVSPEQERQIKDQLIKFEIFTQEAKRRGLDVSPQYKSQIELAQQQVLQQLLVEDISKKSASVSDAELKTEYDRLSKEAPVEYHSRHILVEDETKAKALLAQLQKGAKFEDLARKNSKDPGTAASGGDLGWAQASSYVTEFSQALQSLKKGQLTPAPVKSQFGYHIIRMEDSRTMTPPPFDQISAQLKQGMEQQRVASALEALQKNAKIQ